MRKPRVIPDEDHEVVYERVAAVDVAKASGVVCMRLPDPARPGRYSNQVWDNVPAARARIGELGRELLRHQVQMVTLESTSRLLADLVLRAGKHRAGGAAGVRVAGQEPEGAAEDGPVDRTSGPVFGVVRAESGDAG